MAGISGRSAVERVLTRIQTLVQPDPAPAFALQSRLVREDFVGIAPVREGTLYAIDGSNALLAEGGWLTIAAMRAGMSRFQDGSVVERALTPVWCAAPGSDSGRAEFEALYQECFGGAPGFVPSFDDPARAITSMREILELFVAREVAGRLMPGDCLLFDGSCRGATPPLDALYQEITGAASAQVSKFRKVLTLKDWTM
ncbi:MAG: hypothetical protein NT074_06325 [Methanomicrobiales archaeon]|nr:hypothetical protein [Methanomicrobiales archaeon]